MTPKITQAELPQFLNFSSQELANYQKILAILKEYYPTDPKFEKKVTPKNKDTLYESISVEKKEIRKNIEDLPIKFICGDIPKIPNIATKKKISPWVDKQKNRKLEK